MRKQIVDDVLKNEYETIGIEIPNKITIPASDGEIVPSHDIVADFVVDILNHDGDDTFLDLILNPADNRLEQIILIVDDDNSAKKAADKLKKKNKWSRARKINFVIDALDPAINSQDLNARHFISAKRYISDLGKFFPECQEYLLEREKNNLNVEYNGCGALVFDLAKSLFEISKPLREKLDKDGLKGLSEIKNAVGMNFYEELPFKPFADAIDQMQNLDPDFLYLRQLVPDDKFHEKNMKERSDNYSRNVIAMKSQKEEEPLAKDKSRIVLIKKEGKVSVKITITCIALSKKRGNCPKSKNSLFIR